MRIRDIKTACNKLLLSAVEGCRVYDTDTKDGYIRPAFFTEIIPRSYRNISQSALQMGITFKATLLETTHDEAFCLDVIDAVREAFGLTVKCESGFRLLVDEIDWDWIDNSNDVLQITIDFAEFVAIRNLRGKPYSGDMMEVLDMDVYMQTTGGDLKSVIDGIRDGKIRFYFTDEGRLRALKIGVPDEYVYFDSYHGHLTASMIDSLSHALTFYIDGTGHVFASLNTEADFTDMFNIYVTAKET